MRTASRNECLVRRHERHEDEATDDEIRRLGEWLLAHQEQLGLRLRRHRELQALVVAQHGEPERVAARGAIHEVREGDAHEVVRAGQLDRAIVAYRHAV